MVSEKDERTNRIRMKQEWDEKSSRVHKDGLFRTALTKQHGALVISGKCKFLV